MANEGMRSRHNVTKSGLTGPINERGERLLKLDFLRRGPGKETCKECGCKIRGDNHENGSHHRGRVKMKVRD